MNLPVPFTVQSSGAIISGVSPASGPQGGVVTVAVTGENTHWQQGTTSASFVQFGPSAMLGFLVFGPMVDLKLVSLYAGTFRRGFARTVVLVAAVATFVGALWVGVAFG